MQPNRPPPGQTLAAAQCAPAGPPAPSCPSRTAAAAPQLPRWPAAPSARRAACPAPPAHARWQGRLSVQPGRAERVQTCCGTPYEHGGASKQSSATAIRALAETQPMSLQLQQALPGSTLCITSVQTHLCPLNVLAQLLNVHCWPDCRLSRGRAAEAKAVAVVRGRALQGGGLHDMRFAANTSE